MPEDSRGALLSSWFIATKEAELFRHMESAIFTDYAQIAMQRERGAHEQLPMQCQSDGIPPLLAATQQTPKPSEEYTATTMGPGLSHRRSVVQRLSLCNDALFVPFRGHNSSGRGCS